MARCFVIQPFDNDKFDKRYDDVFSPAIEAAGLEPYRVDRDPGTNDLVEGIKAGIASAAAFLADITIDNPNVWYELGTAMSVEIPFCVCCSEERTAVFPFDVSHLKIIKYKVGSTSDFTELHRKIAERLKAVVSREAKLRSISESVNSVTETRGLAPYESVALTILFEYEFETDGVVPQVLQRDMERAGFTKAATNLAIAELMDKGLIGVREESDHDFGRYKVFKLNKEGIDWLRQNKDQLVLRQPKASSGAPADIGETTF